MRSLSVLSLLSSITALACSSSAPAPPTPTTTRIVTVARGTLAAPDGVPVAYEVRGGGDVALVFVHCWACDRTFWRDQLDFFDDEFQVVALDLPGHGLSGRRKGATLLELGDDVARLVETLDLGSVILIGHSMGGPVALAAASRLRGRVRGILCLDTLHDARLVPTAEMVEKMASSFEDDFEGTMAGFVRSAFGPEADPATVERVVRKAQAADRATALELLRDFPNLDLEALFRGAGVPIRCINAAPRGPDGAVTDVETNRLYADYDAELMEGVGHFLHIERPAEVNERLRRLIRELLKS